MIVITSLDIALVTLSEQQLRTSQTCSHLDIMPRQKRAPCEEISTNVPRPTKRARTNFLQSQLDALEHVFQQTQYPDVTVLEGLAEHMGLQIEKVCTWFQNRRSRFRKESKKGHMMWMRNQFFAPSAEKTLPLDDLSLRMRSRPEAPLVSPPHTTPSCDAALRTTQQVSSACSYPSQEPRTHLAYSPPLSAPQQTSWYPPSQAVSPMTSYASRASTIQSECTEPCCTVREEVTTPPSCSGMTSYPALTDAIYQGPCQPYPFYWPPGAYQSQFSFQYDALPSQEPRITLEQGELVHGVPLSSIRTVESPASLAYPSFPSLSPHLPDLIPESQ